MDLRVNNAVQNTASYNDDLVWVGDYLLRDVTDELKAKRGIVQLENSPVHDTLEANKYAKLNTKNFNKVSEFCKYLFDKTKTILDGISNSYIVKTLVNGQKRAGIVVR